MEVLRKYGAATTINFPLIDAGANDFESTPVTFAAGDTKIKKDEGASANTTNNPAHEGEGIYSLALTATEMQAARIVITIIDSATKAWEDQAVLISTYGNASAQHAFDLDTASTAQTGDNYARLGTPAGASVSADIAAIEAQTDDIGVAGAGLSAIPWNAAWDAEVQSEVNDALVAIHLDHLLAVDYDPASKPGVATALFNELIESDAGVSRYTANALEQAPDTTTGLSLAADQSGVTVGTVSTLTGHTAQTGDSFARLGAPAGASVSADIAALNDLSAAEVNAEMVDALTVDTIAELAQGQPAATPTIATALMLLYMALRNKLDTDATTLEIHNNAGTVIAKKTLSDDGTTYSEAKMASGP